MTLYAAQAASRANGVAAAGGSSSTAVAEPPEVEAPESFAEAVAASALADLPPGPSFAELDRKLERLQAGSAVAVASPALAAAAQPAAKKEDRVVCKVCGGSGQVAYENHMTLYDGTTCPCCLVSAAGRRGCDLLVNRGMQHLRLSCLAAPPAWCQCSALPSAVVVRDAVRA